MYLAKVIGNIWGTHKYPGLEGVKLLIIQPISIDGKLKGNPIIAADTVGAGEGELVIYITAYEAVIPLERGMVPIDATIVGIIESSYYNKKYFNIKDKERGEK